MPQLLKTVGLDSYIGYCHTLRSGRVSPACDLVEEARCIAERFVLTWLNLQIIGKNDFDKTHFQVQVWLSDDGRKKVLDPLAGKEAHHYDAPIFKTENPPWSFTICSK